MTKAVRTKTKEEQLKDLVFKMFTEEHVDVELRCPLNLVRVIPKENTSRGGIILPDQHNKLLYEGIVVQVWNPATAREPYLDGPELHIGDHVVFQHFVGIPLFDLLDKDKYRMIKDDDVPALLHYRKKSTPELIDALFIRNNYSLGASITKLCEEFDVVPKGQKPLTESGK